MTADELARRMSLRELSEWAIVFKLEAEAREKASREAEAKSRKGRR